MNITEFDLPLIGKINIKFRNKRLYEYTKRQLALYYIGTSQGAESEDRYQSVISIQNAVILDFINEILKCEYQYSRDIYVNNGVLHINQTQVVINNDIVYLFNKKCIGTGIKAYVKEMSMSLEKRYSIYHLLFYDCILFPIFLLYSYYGCFLIHGSLLTKNKETIIISGLDGVGKSSISNLLQKQGWGICADNFVLFNGDGAIPLNLALRLAPEQETDMKVLYKDRNVKEVLPNCNIKEMVHPVKIYNLVISKELFMKPLFCKLLYWSNYLNNAGEIAAANAFLSPFFFQQLQKQDAKSDILCMYVLGVPRGEMMKGVELILNGN